MDHNFCINNKKKILILTSSTGGGHDARAKSLYLWFKKVIGSNFIDIKIENIIENSSLIGKLGVYINNMIDRFCPYLHYLYWYFIELLGQSNRRLGLLVGQKYYLSLINTYKPDLIISVHDFTNFGYFEIAKKINNKIKCVTYCGEFSGGFGYSKNWANPNSDWFIARNTTALEYAHKLGIKPEKSSCFSTLINPDDYFGVFSTKDKKSFLKNVLYLSDNKFTVFLTTGNNGYNNHIPFLEILKKYYKDIQAIVVCGKNNFIYNKVLKWQKNNQNFNLYLESHSFKVTKLIQVSDVVVTRGGANTSAESLYYEKPMLYNSIKGSVPQEILTMKYFHKSGAAVILKNLKQFESIIKSWKNFSIEYKNIINNIKKIKPINEHPKNLILFLMKLINLKVNV